MAKNVELMEPGEAIPKNRGYVGVTDAGGKITFPHVDSCCAVSYVFADGSLIGGHIGAQWPGDPKINYELNGDKILELMEANRSSQKKGQTVTTLVTVSPDNWGRTKNHFLQRLRPARTLNIDTAGLGGGVDVEVTAKAVVVKSCKNRAVEQSFALPDRDDEYQEVKFTAH